MRNAQLGFADPISAVFGVMALKNLFGFGAKKRKLKIVEGQQQGYWTTQWPPDIDWRQYLTADHGDGNAGAVQKAYDVEHKKKTVLIKNNIATPEDYAAWHFTKLGQDYAKAGSKGWIPYRLDGTRYDEPSLADAAALQASAAVPLPRIQAPNSAMTGATLSPILQPFLPLASPQIQSFFPGAPQVSTPAAPAPETSGRPSQRDWLSWIIPAAAAAVIALSMSNRRQRRK